jgi:opacity protein-like surface antigen
MKRLLFGAFFVTVFAVTPARAQGDRPVHFNIGGGFTTPLSEIGERFGTGGGFNIGMIIEPSPVFGIQVEYAYNNLAGEETTIPLVEPTPAAVVNGQALIESHHSVHAINFNGILKMSGDSIVKPYAIGGAGAYYRTVSLTTPDVGFTTYCDPYWYVCFPAAVEVDRIVGDRSSWDPGVSIGGGVSFALGESALFYVETRWHYIWGPEFTDRDGVTQKANGQYFPVTFGFRF